MIFTIQIILLFIWIKLNTIYNINNNSDIEINSNKKMKFILLMLLYHKIFLTQNYNENNDMKNVYFTLI
jgi:hypothetical protein